MRFFVLFFWKFFSYFQNPPGEGRRRPVSPRCALRPTTGPPQRSSRRSSRPAARSAGAPSSATRSPASPSGAHLPTPPAHFFHRFNTFNFFPKHHFLIGVLFIFRLLFFNTKMELCHNGIFINFTNGGLICKFPPIHCMSHFPFDTFAL